MIPTSALRLSPFGEHDGYDQRHLDHGHGQCKEQRSERLSDEMGDHLRMIDRRHDRRPQQDGDDANGDGIIRFAQNNGGDTKQRSSQRPQWKVEWKPRAECRRVRMSHTANLTHRWRAANVCEPENSGVARPCRCSSTLASTCAGRR